VAKKHIKPELELMWGVRESDGGVNSPASGNEVLTWMSKGT
jgi:hypothetical protein